MDDKTPYLWLWMATLLMEHYPEKYREVVATSNEGSLRDNLCDLFAMIPIEGDLEDEHY